MVSKRSNKNIGETPMPPVIRVGYKNFSMHMMSEEDAPAAEEMGLCFKDGGRIFIRSGLSDIEHANTILHEVIHAIFHTQGLIQIDRNTEELITNAISNGMIGVMRDNPDLFIYLFTKLAQESEG